MNEANIPDVALKVFDKANKACHSQGEPQPSPSSKQTAEASAEKGLNAVILNLLPDSKEEDYHYDGLDIDLTEQIAALVGMFQERAYREEVKPLVVSALDLLQKQWREANRCAKHHESLSDPNHLATAEAITEILHHAPYRLWTTAREVNSRHHSTMVLLQTEDLDDRFRQELIEGTDAMEADFQLEKGDPLLGLGQTLHAKKENIEIAQQALPALVSKVPCEWSLTGKITELPSDIADPSMPCKYCTECVEVFCTMIQKRHHQTHVQPLVEAGTRLILGHWIDIHKKLHEGHPVEIEEARRVSQATDDILGFAPHLRWADLRRNNKENLNLLKEARTRFIEDEDLRQQCLISTFGMKRDFEEEKEILAETLQKGFHGDPAKEAPLNAAARMKEKARQANQRLQQNLHKAPYFSIGPWSDGLER